MSKSIFRLRAPEWFLSAGLTVWGVETLLSKGIFKSTELAPMLDIMSQAEWGILATLIGLVRLLFLFINGRWRPSAHIRALGAIFGCLTWGMLFMSTLSVDWVTPITSLYATLLGLDLLALWYCAGDAKLADLEAKKEK